MSLHKTRQFIRVNGVDLCYDLADYTDPWSEEEPEAILLHHGYCRNMSSFRNWVPLLGRSFRVLRFDARGCGDSEKPQGQDGYTIAQFAEDARVLIAELSIPRVHWIGESSGGIVGLVLALRHPELFHSITLCNTPLKRRAEVGAAFTLGEADQETAIRKFGVGEWCRRTIEFRLDMTKASEAMARWYACEMDKTPPRAAIAMHADIGRVDLLPHLPKLALPTLILASGHSKVAQEEQMRQMREILPSAELVVFSEYGHGLNVLAPDECAAEVRRFIGNIGKPANT
jgi:pimeloyl-ACP methyl ester carboxylesterase